MKILRHYSPQLKKIYLTFYDTNNYKNGENNSRVASIFNETYFQSNFLIYTEKKKGRKNLNSNSHLGDTKFDE